MNEFKWAKGIKHLFQGDRNKADFNQFIAEISNENFERMAFQKEFNEVIECRPSFEQIGQDRIVDEVNKDIHILKAFETILEERVQSFKSFLQSLSKVRTSFDVLQFAGGTMRQAFDTFFVFVEQELQQARQQQGLADVRKALSEVKVDAQRRLTDYHHEISQAEKDVVAAEKKLSKTKEQFEKCSEHKAKLESFDGSEIMTNPRMPRYGRDGRSDRLREAEDAVHRCEREIREDVRALLHAISNRDQVLMASRRAYQKLDRECKKALANTLRRMIAREKDVQLARESTLSKLEAAVEEIDVDGDMSDFIARFKCPEGNLVLSSRALSILNDLMPEPESRLGRTSSGSGGSNAPNVPVTAVTPIPSSPIPQKGASGGAGFDSLFQSPLNSLWGGGGGGGGAGGASHSTIDATSSAQTTDPIAGTSLSSSSTDGGLLHSTDILSGAVLWGFGQSIGATDGPVPDTPTSSAQDDEAVWRERGSNSSQPEDSGSLTGPSSSGGSARARGATKGRKSITQDPSTTALNRDVTRHLTRIFYPNDRDLLDRPTSLIFGSDPIDPLDTDSITPLNSAGLGITTSDGPPPKPLRPQSMRLGSHKGVGEGHFPVHMDSESDGAEGAELEGNATTQRRHSSPSVPLAIPLPAQRKLEENFSTVGSASPALPLPLSEPLVASINFLAKTVESQVGRDCFITVLNQFRSRKVDVGAGFGPLGAVLWTTLDHCFQQNDIHNSKIVMMLSQTFYRRVKGSHRRKDQKPLDDQLDGSELGEAGELEVDVETRETGQTERRAQDEAEDGDGDGGDDGDDENRIRAEEREYIKDMLCTHEIWHNGNFWEQALWQCAIEQLKTIPYDQAWHDMDKEDRADAVRRVHDVIFSQVMAITHSMMELGCTKVQTREFLYRMCVIHQLEESQRQDLLAHLHSSALSVSASSYARDVGTYSGQVGVHHDETASV